MKHIFRWILCLLVLLPSLGFSATDQLIQIKTQNTVMVIQSSPNKDLRFLYWGDQLNAGDSFTQGLNAQGEISAYPAYGGRVNINPALKLTHIDGLLTTELGFQSVEHKSLDNNVSETIIKMKDLLYDFVVNIHYTAYFDQDVITQYVTLENNEKGQVAVEQVASSFLPIYANQYYLTHFYGSWAHEFMMEEEQLTHGIKKIESLKGVRTTQTDNPSFLLALNHKAQENEGEVYGGALAWSGNYTLSFQEDPSGRMNIVSGINPFASTIKLEKGETFATPKMILSYSDCGKGQISRNFHNWAREYGMTHGSELNPTVLNSWEGVYFSFDEKSIKGLIDDAASMGVEMFVLDDGWFGNKYPRNNDKAGLGDWQVNHKKLPKGIGDLADYAVNKGVKFGIWIEPEMVNPKSELAENHPDWIVQSGKREKYQQRNQWLLDLSNPKVQDYVYSVFDEVMKMSSNISYIKWDANRHVDNVGSTYLPADKQTHFWYDYTQGLYSVYQRIRENYPDVIIQDCSSGGGRVDFGAMKYHDEFWASDNTNALDRIFIQYGTNTFFPAMATASHVSTAPNHQTGMVLPLKFRFDVASTGRLGMELQPKDIPAQELPFAKAALKTYKEILRPIVMKGDLYRLISPYDNDGSWYSILYVSKDKKESAYFTYNLKTQGRETHLCSKLRGLDPNKTYRIEELNKAKRGYFAGDGKTFTGDYLMKVGIPINFYFPYESCVLHLVAVN